VALTARPAHALAPAVNGGRDVTPNSPDRRIAGLVTPLKLEEVNLADYVPLGPFAWP
jgi:hypothetical protein